MSGQKYYSLLTEIGKNKIANATVNGKSINIVEMAVGDGSGEIDENMTELENVKWRGDINEYSLINKDFGRIKVSSTIPEDIGGFVVREVGLIDDEGDLIVVTNYPPTNKPEINEGIISAMTITVVTDISNVDNVTVQTNPLAVDELREDINNKIGYIPNLKTQNKTNIVAAVNELVTTKQQKPFGVVIDENNANPETRVKYIGGAEGFSPVRGNNGNIDWGSWRDTWVYDIFNPCLVKNSEVNYYLDKEDLTKKTNGENAVLTGADGDVMIEIDKVWLKINTIDNKKYIQIANNETSGFSCLAHTNGDKVVDKIYVGRYLGYEQDGRLRSISGVEPTGNKKIGEFRELAEANGDRYHQVPFPSLTLLQSIMTIMLKSTDTQSALGRGHVDDGESFSKTGNTDKKGMMFGETGGQANSGQMCFMGIEDFWGNKRWWVDGLKYDDGKIKLATTNFNDNASGYEIVGSYDETGGGYIQTVKGTTETGFIPDKRNGSGSTYYCDYGYVHDGLFPSFGGFRSHGSTAGGFYLYSDSASYSFSALGSRLFMYGK